MSIGSKKDNKFPVQESRAYPGMPRFVKWSELSEDHAKKIHDQSLERLAQRHGLCPAEVACNYYKLSYEELISIGSEKVEECMTLIGLT